MLDKIRRIIKERLEDLQLRRNAALESWPMPSNELALATASVDIATIEHIKLDLWRDWQGF